ncbi:MAG: RnfABCDGE type electron transport complex subunit G [Deltaproteobacteria bacterium]|nr:RnfABCDGE type electron transport complex subunit G [Deltaproteobacteria bacterium]
MREMIKMIVVLTILSSFSGGLLAALKNGTQEKIDYQELKNVKGPAIESILKGCENDPIVDRFKITDGEQERSFFVGIFNGKPKSVAFETYGKGFAGKVGVIVGVNLEDGSMLGAQVTTHNETPGVGSKAKDDPSFVSQFTKKIVTDTFGVKQDGGNIDAIAGATITSRGVCMAVTQAGEIYKRLKPEIAKQLDKFK